MGIRSADYFLAAAGLLGHCLVLLLLARRHWLRRLPAFALLIAFYLLRSVLFLIPRFSTTQPEMYWLLIYLDPVLQLLVLLGFAVLAWRLRKSTPVAIPFMLLLAALCGWLGPGSHYSPQTLAIKLSIFVSALWLQAALALFLVLRKGDPQTNRLPLGIALGFAAYSAINIVTEAVRLHSAALSHLRVAVYLGCLAAWSFLLRSPSHAWRETAHQRETAGR